MSRQRFIDAVSSLDARTDVNIENYFVETGSINAVRTSTSDGVAIIGLKGTGKTTLYRSLVEQWQGHDGFHTVGLSNDTASFEAYFDQINCLQFERSVRVGMAFFLLKLVDKHIVADSSWSGIPAWIDRKNKLFAPGSRALEILKRFQGLSIMGVGLTLRAPDNNSAFEPVTSDEADEVLDLLKSFNGGDRRLRVVIDDPDRLFTKGTTFDPHLLAGYILGTNALARELDYVNFVHVIKSNVYDSLSDVEEISNLPYDYFRYIGWTKKELSNLLSERIRYSDVSPDDLFEDPEGYGLDLFLDRIRNGPRDLLRYIEIILKSSPTAKIGRDTIVANEERFRHEARRQMESVYSIHYTGIESFLTHMFASGSTLPVSSFIERFEVARMESRPHAVDYKQGWLRTGERSLRALLDAGVVDAFMQGRWVRPYEQDYFRFNARAPDALIRRNSVFG
jgi:hypothetical protein